MPFPGSLESQYSNLMSKFLDAINAEYMKALVKVLKESDETVVLNTMHFKVNVPLLNTLKNRLRAIRKGLLKSSTFKNIFESMKGIFTRVDREIVKNIKKQFKQAKFPVPELDLKVDPKTLEDAVELNVSLIEAIPNIQVDEMEAAVLKAVKGGANFEDIVKEVESQSDRGKAYAEFVARDQVGKTYAAVNKERQTQSGFPFYIWEATNDSRTRDTHRALDGTTHSWDKPPLVPTDGRAKNMHPGEDYQCRCIAVGTFQAA